MVNTHVHLVSLSLSPIDMSTPWNHYFIFIIKVKFLFIIVSPLLKGPAISDL